jgi:hypothetical protein
MDQDLLHASLLSISEDVRLGPSDTDLIPKGSLFCRCAAVLLGHELRTQPARLPPYEPPPVSGRNTTQVPLRQVKVAEDCARS